MLCGLAPHCEWAWQHSNIEKAGSGPGDEVHTLFNSNGKIQGWTMLICRGQGYGGWGGGLIKRVGGRVILNLATSRPIDGWQGAGHSLHWTIHHVTPVQDVSHIKKSIANT